MQILTHPVHWGRTFWAFPEERLRLSEGSSSPKLWHSRHWAPLVLNTDRGTASPPELEMMGYVQQTGGMFRATLSFIWRFKKKKALAPRTQTMSAALSHRLALDAWAQATPLYGPEELGYSSDRLL